MRTETIRPHMEVIGSDGGHVGTVDRLEHGHVKLTRGDDPAGLGGHRQVPLSAVAEVEAGRVRLTLPAAEARAMAAGGNRPEQMEEGFTGTGVPVPSPSGVPDPGQADAERGPRDVGGHGPGFRGDPNMDPSGRGEV